MGIRLWTSRVIVLFEKPSRETDRQQPFRTLLYSHQVQALYLSDFQDAIFESVELSVLQLIVVEPEVAIERAKQVIKRATASKSLYFSSEQILELVETIIVYKFPSLTREVVSNMLMIDELKQTRVYKDALEEGRQEGRQEGQYILILKLLSRKLSSLPDTAIAQIQSLDSEQLDALSDRLLDISTLEDLTNCLSNIAAKQ